MAASSHCGKFLCKFRPSGAVGANESGKYQISSIVPVANDCTYHRCSTSMTLAARPACDFHSMFGSGSQTSSVCQMADVQYVAVPLPSHVAYHAIFSHE